MFPADSPPKACRPRFRLWGGRLTKSACSAPAICTKSKQIGTGASPHSLKYCQNNLRFYFTRERGKIVPTNCTLIREMQATVIDSCEQIEAVGYTEKDRDR